jgi:signal peptide peptidase SppA
MRFDHILHALYCEPWLISADMHSQLCEIVDAHISGTAHAPEGNVAQFDDGAGKVKDVEVVGGVAIVPLVGVVGKRIGMMERSSGVMDVDDFTTSLQAALDNDRVSGILLDVNSPGGTITGIPEAADMVSEASSIKPIVAFTDTLMASAAYWLSVGADAIVATQSASVGSIGVYSSVLDSSMAFKMAGLEQNLFKAGKLKAIGTQGIMMSDEQKEYMQSRVDQLYGWFTSSVLEGRGIVQDGSMEGQTFFGREAESRGLIDKVGDQDEALGLVLDLIDMRRG